jgi:hypothetical protein
MINDLPMFFYFSLSLKEFLPKEYIKQRGAEKRIFQVLEIYRNLLSSPLPVLTYQHKGLPHMIALYPVYVLLENK